MGGDQLVEKLTDADLEHRLGDQIRSRESERYSEMIGEVEAVSQASELLSDLRDRDHTVILARSAKQTEIEHYIDLLGARQLADGWTSASDVQATKPQPDLVNAALKRADAQPEQAVMIGDSPRGRPSSSARRRADTRGDDRRLLKRRVVRSRRHRCL
jgi:HAD superfamily hydrolase (TIGR01509 family)